MIFPKVEVEQISGNELLIRDITPDYSYLYPGGFGFPNIEKSLIRKVNIIVTISGLSFEIEQDYDQLTGEVILDSTNLPYTNFVVTNPPDCNGCSKNQTLIKGEGDELANWPSGCVTLEYRIKYFDLNIGALVCSEKHKINLVLYYHQEQEMINIFEKFPFELSGCDIKRSENMQKLIFAWERLSNIGKFQSCSCECIQDVIFSVDLFLKEIEL